MPLVSIFSGRLNPATTLAYFGVIYIVRIILALVIGPVSFFPNLILTFAIGFGLVKCTFEYPDSSIWMKILCWVIAFSQIGMFMLIRV